MESDCNEKITLKFTPCKPPTPCSDYDDYDPYESSDALDEKDLAILLEEEKAKLQKAREKAQFEEEAQLQGERESREDERLKSESERFGRTKKCKGKKDGATKEEKAPKKKCAKVIKNPFFGNRLEFSSDLPPPPPNPPAQFFPAAEEEERKPKFPCSKRKSGKPKFKKTDEDDKNKNEMEHADNAELNRGKGEIEYTYEEEWGMFGMGPDSDKAGQGREEADDSRIHGNTWNTWKRKCQKALDRTPCRKRDADVCDPLQPRQIPARLGDLPARPPLELPEVERQMWLSSDIDCPMECARNNCQMSCSKRKCKKKRQSSLDESSN